MKYKTGIWVLVIRLLVESFASAHPSLVKSGPKCLYKCTQRLNAEVKPSDRGIYFIMVSELTRINSPDAQSSSSAPFSQSFSPSHLHDNETHLLVDPPQSNFSGGHVCLPVGRDKRDREITVVLWSIKATTTTTRRHSWTWFLSPPQCS